MNSLDQDKYSFMAVMSKISSIHEAIKSFGKIDFASPDLFRELPFHPPFRFPTNAFLGPSPPRG